MQKLTFIASVKDIGLFGGLAVTRRRLMTSAIVATLAVIGYGLLVADFVQNQSQSVVLNTLLISAQFFLVLGAAYVQAMWAGTLWFGDTWRRRTFLGERSVADGIDVEAIRDNSLHFYGVFGAAMVASYFAVVLATDDYVDRYNVSGFYHTSLRSDDPERRITALKALVDPVRESSAMDRSVREHVIAVLDDDVPEVQAWAAWAAGHLMIFDAAPALLRVLQDGEREARVEAALALGRLRDLTGERRMIGVLPTVLDDPELTRAVVTGLGLIPSNDAVPLLMGLLGAAPEQVEVAALWAIGRTRTLDTREEILRRWSTSEGGLRCAYADLLKHVTVLEDDATMREAFRDAPREDCEAVMYEGRQYDPEHPLVPITYVIGEELRRKYMIASFNIAGPGLRAWLIDIAWADDESDPMRVLADKLAEEIRTGPSRQPRE